MASLEGGQKLLQRVLVGATRAPEGLRLSFTHSRECKGRGKNETKEKRLNEAIFDCGKPKTTGEMIGLARSAMWSMGCRGYDVDKETSAGIFFEHSRDSEYSPPDVTDRGSSENWMSLDLPSSSHPTWGTLQLGPMDSQERYLYKGMRLDDSRDETYQPLEATVPKRGEVDVAITLEGGKNTEATGLRDSKHATAENEIVVEETQLTVQYSGGTDLDRAMWECVDKVMEGNVTCSHPGASHVSGMIGAGSFWINKW